MSYENIHNIITNKDNLSVQGMDSFLLDRYDNNRQFGINYNYGNKLSHDDTVNEFIKALSDDGDFNLYFHIPFCKSKCDYCPYHSFPSVKMADEYLDLISKETDMWIEKMKILSNLKIKTVYIGGGSPNILDLQQNQRFIEIISRFKDYFDEEMLFTLEINPTTLQLKEKLSQRKSIGLNRVSIGIQTFNQSVLESHNRYFQNDEIISTLDLVKSMEFDFNMDFMYGLKGQSLDQLKFDCNKVLEYLPSHLTFYPLYFFENTPLYRSGKYFISWKELLDQYDFIKANLPMYEFYAMEYATLNGDILFRLDSQINYLEGKNVLGIGLSSWSSTKHLSFSNTWDYQSYNQSIQGTDFSFIRDSYFEVDQKKKLFYLGIRRNFWSIDVANGFKDFIDFAVMMGFVLLTGDGYTFTDRGRSYQYVLTTLFDSFIADLYGGRK